MSDNLLNNGSKPTLVLPAVLDLTAAEQLKQDLLCALSDGTGIDIDAGAVQRITTPCFQVLAVAAKTITEDGGGTMRFLNLPGVFRETAETLGLAGVLGLAEI